MRNFECTNISTQMIFKVIKRDYTTTDFKIGKISNATCSNAICKQGSLAEANDVAVKVLEILNRILKTNIHLQ